MVRLSVCSRSICAQTPVSALRKACLPQPGDGGDACATPPRLTVLQRTFTAPPLSAPILPNRLRQNPACQLDLRRNQRPPRHPSYPRGRAFRTQPRHSSAALLELRAASPARFGPRFALHSHVKRRPRDARYSRKGAVSRTASSETWVFAEGRKRRSVSQPLDLAIVAHCVDVDPQNVPDSS